MPLLKKGPPGEIVWSQNGWFRGIGVLGQGAVCRKIVNQIETPGQKAVTQACLRQSIFGGQQGVADTHTWTLFDSNLTATQKKMMKIMERMDKKQLYVGVISL
jgi:hypothetical protein